MRRSACSPPALAGLLAAAIALPGPPPAAGLDRVVLATNWKAQPEHGGFYQALTDGEYARQGLDVSIVPGGPMVNNRPLLALGKVDFLIGTNLLQPFDAARQNIPTRAVAAFFQRDPQCILVHPDQGYEAWADLKRAPLLMANSGRFSFFLWMKSAHGFDPRLLRPYNHSLTPFLLNKTWAMQGYVTAEPQRVAETLGQEPRAFLLADHGWQSYSTLLETREALVRDQPELVQRFVDASIVGWARYLYGDNAAANAKIREDNPAMTEGQIAFSLKKMRELGLIDSGDATQQGIGAMRAERIAAFYRQMIDAELYREGDVDVARSYDLQFVNRGAGVAEIAALKSALPAAAEATTDAPAAR